jgi:hypothetical protein
MATISFLEFVERTDASSKTETSAIGSNGNFKQGMEA